MIKYFIKKKGGAKRIGPFNLKQLKKNISEGLIKPTDLYSTDKKNWRPVSSLKKVFDEGTGEYVSPNVEAEPEEDAVGATTAMGYAEAPPSSGAYNYWEKRTVENQVIKKKAWSASWRDYVFSAALLGGAYGLFWYVFESGKIGNETEEVGHKRKKKKKSAKNSITSHINRTKNAVSTQGEVITEHAENAQGANKTTKSPNAKTAGQESMEAPAEAQADVVEKIDLEMINEFDSGGMTPLMRYAYDGNYTMVKSLLEKGAKPDMVDQHNSATALYWAIIKKHEDVACHLIDEGADLNKPNKDKVTPVLKAVANNLTRTATLLIKLGANLNVPSPQGDTALDWSIHHGNYGLETLLRRKGAYSYKELLSMVRYGQIEKAKEIIEAVPGFATQKTQVGETVLHHALFGRDPNKVNAMLKALVSAGADVNQKTSEGKTVLHLAVDKKNSENVKVLLELGANVNEVDENGSSLLHHLASEINESSMEISKALLAKGAKVDVINKDKDAPIHIAVKKDNPDFLKLLLKSGANANIEDGEKQKPLDLAKRYISARCAKALEAVGAQSSD